MNSLLARLESDMAMSMSALHCLKMEPGLRKRIAETLVPNPKMKVSNIDYLQNHFYSFNMKDILYIILIANNRVVTLIRPRKHSIHPAGIYIHIFEGFLFIYMIFLDLHIILNTIHSPSIYNSPANASWIPVCLPKFNPTGFVNAYITFLRKDDTVDLQDISNASVHSAENPAPTETDAEVPDPQEGLNESGIALVCISGGGELEFIRNWCDSVIHVNFIA